MKNHYIEIMEMVLKAYSIDEIMAYIEEVSDMGLREHGFTRLTANIGILIANKRRLDLTDIYLKMMDICCEQIPGKRGAANDFSVKEIVFCILEIEKNYAFERALTEKWRKKLSAIDPYTTYDVIAESPPQRIKNWAAFGAASEQIRKMAGLGKEEDFIENQILSQLLSFDENGMYRDPNEPIVYEMGTRLQLAVTLFFGYSGKGREELEEQLMRSAEATLKMQSVTGEIPYGGRSNQFVFNEAFYAALCEFYAGFYKKRGAISLAGQFKRAARLATDSVLTWLETNDTIYHVKNYFERSSLVGCEKYAYFNKYMITTASSLYLAYLMADDEVTELPCPAEIGGYIWQTSECFHKVFCNHSGYFLEIDTSADYHYDASGIGRIHYKGAPGALCCSLPFTQKPNYNIDILNPSPLSLSAGVRVGDVWHFAWEQGTEYIIKSKEVNDECASIVLEAVWADGSVVKQTVVMSQDGISMNVKGEQEIRLTLPIFCFDGKKKTEIISDGQKVIVRYNGWECSFSTDGQIEDTNLLYANRNGHYRRFDACATEDLNVHIDIKMYH